MRLIYTTYSVFYQEQYRTYERTNDEWKGESDDSRIKVAAVDD